MINIGIQISTADGWYTANQRMVIPYTLYETIWGKVWRLKKHTQKHYIRIGDGEKHKKIAQVRGGSKKNGFQFKETETKIKKKFKEGGRWEAAGGGLAFHHKGTVKLP